MITKLDPETLRNIVSATNGKYIDGRVTSEVINQVMDALQDIEKTEFEARQFAEYKSQFQWFLGLAVILLLLDIFLLERKTAWVRRLNLFNERKKKRRRNSMSYQMNIIKSVLLLLIIFFRVSGRGPGKQQKRPA